MPTFTLRHLILLLNCSVLPACAVQSWNKPIKWETDKMKHFAATTFISAAAAQQLKHYDRDCTAAGHSILFTMSIGATKETYDKYIRKTRFDWGDMTWNLVGSTVGATLGAHCY